VHVARDARHAQLVRVRRYAYGVFRGEVRRGELLFVGDLIGPRVSGSLGSDASRFDVSVARGISRLAALAASVGAVDHL
jgi:hypothetical protein